ncbi:DUF1638 domain-containing protein [Pontiella sulfatireligans]|uniref:DUF1638 domain-containing protein n=1 Tax=Pontiella sulfatireligans TaxID=2750658 RepID=A0A6C2UE76_9BACT|nr:DUF1638 domain-containing protein [Pontiella sulfatireligans]VGO18209.1 hypothetical protein SCARR_00260 [Pontiella sulfatireligans]
MKFKLISCEIFFREMEFLLEQSPHQIDVEFLQKGLHDIPTEEMLKRIQAQVDAASEQNYDTIILGYALCNNGLVGLKARNTKLILTRAHDCITLFFGSRQKYQDYFNAHPGTYFKTTGWIERDYVSEELKPLSIPNQMGMDQTYEELVEQYGEDNAEFLWEELCDTKKNYSQITFIEMGVEPDDRFETLSKQEAVERHWTYEKTAGNLTLIRRLLNGDWDNEDFLTVAPGSEVAASHNENIVKSVPSAGQA